MDQQGELHFRSAAESMDPEEFYGYVLELFNPLKGLGRALSSPGV
jgi:hypothetical protein